MNILFFSEYLHQEEKRREFLPLVWSCFHIIAFFLLLVCVVAFLLTPWLVRLLAPGFGPEQAALTVILVRILLPTIVFMGLAGWAQGVVCFEVFGQRWAGRVSGFGDAPRPAPLFWDCRLRFVVSDFAREGDGLRPQPPPPPESICSLVVLYIFSACRNFFLIIEYMFVIIAFLSCEAARYRFEHGLGVMYLAGRVMDSLYRRLLMKNATHLTSYATAISFFLLRIFLFWLFCLVFFFNKVALAKARV